LGTSVFNFTGANLSFALLGVSSDQYGLFTGYSLSGQLADGQSLSGYVFHDYSKGGQFSGGGSVLTFLGGGGRLDGAPEPGSLLLLVPGLLALAGGISVCRRRSG
jgi:hypothetical protein